MAVNPGVWGIDIGQCALKAIRLEIINSVVTATAFDYVEHPKILSQPDANPDELTREALEKFLSRNPTKGDQVAMSVPGQSGLARFVKLPPVEEKKIADIVNFEAKQQIPFPLEEVVWDFQKVSEGTVTDGFAMDTEIGLFAMKRDMISRFIGHFQAVKLEVHQVQMAPLALANYVTFDVLKKGGLDGDPSPAPSVGKKKCAVALDIGTDGSNLIVTDGGRIIWQRPIPVGGSHFTRALTKELKLTFAKAEHLKRNAAKSPELANILKALRPVLQEFVSEVQRSLGYFTNTHRDAQIEYMVGLGSAFKLPGLQKFLTDKLSLDVRKADKLNRLAGEAVTEAPVFKENVLSFPVAYGLALQGLGVSRLTTNLLPPEITFERKIRAKKPYAVASAAALLLGTTVLAYGYSVPLADVQDKRIETAINTAKGAIGRATTNDSSINAKKEEIKQTQVQVESIVAGEVERPNWIALNQFINTCLPIPGPVGKGSPNLPYNMRVSPVDQFWNYTDGQQAIAKFEQRRAKGVDPLEAGAEDDKREHLAMVDIEAVYGAYTTNLTGLYENIEKKFRDEVGGVVHFRGSYLSPKDWWEEKADRTIPEGGNVEINITEELKPKGEGWAIEVRGYTYWSQGGKKPVPQFIMETVLRNIVQNSRAIPGSDKDPIRGKISHAFLYNVWTDKAPSEGAFQKIGTSFLDPLIPPPGSESTGTEPSGVAPGAGQGMGSMGGPPPGVAGRGEGPGIGGPGQSTGNPSGWVPLIGSAGGGGGAAGFGGPPGLSGPGLGGPPPTPGGPPPGPAAGPAPGSALPGLKNIKPRYEFVIVFVWKEPTPSDKLRQFKVKEAPAASGGGFGPGASPGAPVGGAMPGSGGAGGAPLGVRSSGD